MATRYTSLVHGDGKLLTAGQILTDENDVREAIKQPTGHAIYSSLYKIRDPDAWKRISEPASVVKPDHSIACVVRRIGQALRFMLAVPCDPELKTCSSRHASHCGLVDHQSEIGILVPNIPLQPQILEEPVLSYPAPVRLRDDPTPSRTSLWPGTNMKRQPNVSNDTFRLYPSANSAVFTLAPPPDGRFIQRGSPCGYEQGAFVTVLNPSAVGRSSEKTIAEDHVDISSNLPAARDGESEVTIWPQPDW